MKILFSIHLKVLSEALTPKASLYFLRTHTQREIDFILEYENKLLAIEVKLTDKPSLSDARHLLWFIEEHPQATAAVLHTGNYIKRRHSKIFAVPWWYLA